MAAIEDNEACYTQGMNPRQSKRSRSNDNDFRRPYVDDNDEGATGNNKVNTTAATTARKAQRYYLEKWLSQNDLIISLHELGRMYNERSEYQKALSYHYQGLAVERTIFRSDDPRLIRTLMKIAHVHQQVGDYVAALTNYTEVHRIRLGQHCNGTTTTSKTSHLDIADSLSNMALMHYYQKSYPAAYELYQQALEIQLKSFNHRGSKDLEEEKKKKNNEHNDDGLLQSKIASTLNSIGMILYGQQKFDIAKTCFEDSLRFQRLNILNVGTKESQRQQQIATLLYNLATVYAEMGDDEASISTFQKSLRIEMQVHNGCVVTNTGILALQNLGMIYQKHGDLDESLYYFTEALKSEGSRKDGGNRISCAKMWNLLGNVYLQKGQVNMLMECYSEAARIYHDYNEQHTTQATDDRQQRQQNQSLHRSDLTLIIAGFNFYGLSKLHPPSAAVA